MRLGDTLVSLCLAAAFAAVGAQFALDATQQTGANPNFPFFKCTSTQSPYSLGPTMTSYGNGTFCLRVNVIPVNSTHRCAKADLRKIEFNVRPGCDRLSTIVKATVNGVPTTIGAEVGLAPQGPFGSSLLRMSQLGLGLGSDGTVICLTLSAKDNNPNACTSLETLCQPPPGAPPGVCSTVIFDTTLNCCPQSEVSLPKPPTSYPPPPSPPSPSPPPPSPPPPCPTCGYVSFERTGPVLFPVVIPKANCTNLGKFMISTVKAAAEAAGAYILEISPIVCTDVSVKVCFTFWSLEDAKLLEPVIQEITAEWLQDVMAAGPCPVFLENYNVYGIFAGNGDPFNPPVSDCLNFRQSISCAPIPADPSNPNLVNGIDFPKCPCNTTKAITAFAAYPIITSHPGRRATTRMYCFNLTVVTPLEPDSPCGRSTVLRQVEFYANETQRIRVKAFGVQPGGGTMKFLPESWGPPAENTLKSPRLNWSLEEVNGGFICFEVDRSTDLTTFCNTGTKKCWLNLFDETKECCPMFSASLIAEY